jgi:hypothetical protein
MVKLMDEYFEHSPTVRKRHQSLQEIKEHCIDRDVDESCSKFSLFRLREKQLTKLIKQRK